MVFKLLIALLSLVNLVACYPREHNSSKCQEGDSYFYIIATKENEHRESITFDNINGGGVLFSGFSWIDSGTSNTSIKKISYNKKAKKFTVETRRNVYVLTTINYECIQKLKAFFDINQIKLFIEMEGG